LDKEPAIIVREPDATMQPTPQDNQPMSKHCVLGFKPQRRLEWGDQDGKNEIEQSDHSTSLGDSTRSSTRIRFSVHTGSASDPPFFAAKLLEVGGASERGDGVESSQAVMATWPWLPWELLILRYTDFLWHRGNFLGDCGLWLTPADTE
jgi:hypothetical protein